ncbi:MAG: glycosyltransferase family 2 protein [Steroidobacteraceae bacterium]
MPGLTVALLVKNEAGRYLGEVLDQWVRVADRLLVVDDGSTDGTAELCRGRGAEVVSAAAVDPEASFAHENLLRAMVWRLATRPAPEWIALPDADELMDPPPARWLPHAISSDVAALCCPLYDLWGDRKHYRDDRLWVAHRRFWPALLRYRSGFRYRLSDRAHHTGRWPVNALANGPVVDEERIRILHLGWLTEQDRLAKHTRYAAMDPEGRWGSSEQYASILDPKPHLRRLPPA